MAVINHAQYRGKTQIELRELPKELDVSSLEYASKGYVVKKILRQNWLLLLNIFFLLFTISTLYGYVIQGDAVSDNLLRDKIKEAISYLGMLNGAGIFIHVMFRKTEGNIIARIWRRFADDNDIVYDTIS